MPGSKKRKPTSKQSAQIYPMAAKTIHSQKPDLTVIVGSGQNAREFRCYSVLLAHASPVFDAMLSSGMAESENRRIELPTKDPDDWALFLQCIDPATAACYFFESIYYDNQHDSILLCGEENKKEQNHTLVNETTALRLAPLFHEFEMKRHLRSCEMVLFYSQLKYRDVHDSEEETRLCYLLSFSKAYGLSRLEGNLRDQLSCVLKGEKNYEIWDDDDDQRFGQPDDETDKDSDTINTESPNSRIRSNETDLVVVVGSGESVKEFECYGVILAFASSKLDTLVSSSSGKMHLPNMDPESWDLFYRCIDPRSNGSNLEEVSTFHQYKGYGGSATTLLPWFHEFEMINHSAFCKDIIDYDMKSIEFWIDDWRAQGRGLPIWEIIELLQVVVKHGLKDIQQRAETKLKNWLESGDLLEHCPYIVVKELVLLCVPIKRQSKKDKYVSMGCQTLWQGLCTQIESHLGKMTFDKVDVAEIEMFSHLVNYFIRYDQKGSNNRNIDHSLY